MIVRRARLADLAAVCGIDVRARRWGYRGLLPAAGLAALSEEERALRWRPALAGEGGQRLWLTEDGTGRALGFAAWGPSPDPDLPPGTAELSALYLEEDAAGTGVAGALLEAALADLRLAGHARAALWVLEGNRRARRFYERSGWTADGTRQDVERCGARVAAVRYGRAST